ncbi:hypothetical protein [Asaia sp. As-1742]|uniref:hypothetical protein n=1 Tax=Asaia sp. As-1742 TaxID=2608325 RepID=UPI001F04C580|nr:hypothetical protein [Asaia sp. As-1742]
MAFTRACHDHLLGIVGAFDEFVFLRQGRGLVGFFLCDVLRLGGACGIGSAAHEGRAGSRCNEEQGKSFHRSLRHVSWM